MMKYRAIYILLVLLIYACTTLIMVGTKDVRVEVKDPVEIKRQPEIVLDINKKDTIQVDTLGLK